MRPGGMRPTKRAATPSDLKRTTRTQSAAVLLGREPSNHLISSSSAVLPFLDKPFRMAASHTTLGFGSMHAMRPSTGLRRVSSMHEMAHRPRQMSSLDPHSQSALQLSALPRQSSEAEFDLPPQKFDRTASRPRTAMGSLGGSSLKALEIGRLPFKSWTSPDIIFDMMDRDKSGFIERDEVYRFFRGRLDPDKVVGLFNALDVDESGSVSRDEWIRGYHTAGFGQGAIVGQNADGLGILLDLVSHHYSVDFADLHKHRAPMRIARAEERGITLTQLRDVMAHIEMRCDREGWAGVDGRRLGPDEVTLYDVVRYVIKPATQTHGRCAYVERIAEEAQPPVWFVCNWWGEPFRRVLDCLEQHARDRGVPDHMPYWISAFAHNQWQLEGPAEMWASFQRALRSTIGTLTILDAAGVCLRRSWCLYETYQSLGIPDHKWDLYTAHPHVCVTTFRVCNGRTDGTRHRPCSAVGLLEDYACADFHACEVNKAAREAFFPLRLALQGLQCSLSSSHASVEADRRAVLNAVAGAPLHLSPPEAHEAYDRMSKTIAGRIAIACLRCTANLGPGAPYQSCLAALSASGCERAILGFTSCKQFDASMATALASSLPSSLSRFTFLFRDVDLEAGSAFVTAFAARLSEGQFRKMRHLHLESDSIDSDGARLLSIALGGHGLPKLESISFGLPAPFGHEAASTLAMIAFGVQAPKISFVGDRIPKLSNITLPKLGLTSADVILICASITTGACGMVSALDVSDNKIDNNGLRALEKALKPGTKAFKSTINLNVIDLSNNSNSTKAAKQAVLEARRATDDGSRTRADSGAKANVVRQFTQFKLESGFDFRIVPMVDTA